MKQPSRRKTVYDPDFKALPVYEKFKYQEELTKKLDETNEDFDQNKINEIVLWKVNRYAKLDAEAFNLLNSISPADRVLDLEKTTKVLRRLLKTKGIQLPMASTILRFRNKHVYQIIDQRVYRMIYPREILKLSDSRSDKVIDFKIETYIKYLTDLRKVCVVHDIPFEKADRVLYLADKDLNKQFKLQ